MKTKIDWWIRQKQQQQQHKERRKIDLTDISKNILFLILMLVYAQKSANVYASVESINLINDVFD